MRSASRHVRVLQAAAVLAAGALLTWAFSAGEPSGGTGSGGASSRPTTSTYPSVDLTRIARAASSAMLARLDGGFRALVRPPFVVVGNLPAGELRKLAEGSVVAPAKAMWKSHFRRRPGHVITVLLFRDGKTYKHWARKLFNDTSVPYFGYYKPTRRTLVMNIGTGTGTLVHELTHALIVYDFPRVPTWFNEALASLHEQCHVRADRIVGLVNWRLPALQKAIAARKLRPLGELVTRRDFYGRQQGLNYAQARYLVMFMQRRGLLRKFYQHFRDHHTGPDASVKAIERVFGAGIGKVESEFLRWAMTLRWPARPKDARTGSPSG